MLSRRTKSLVLILAATLGVAGVAAGEPRVVKEPHYGEVLFQFYQENYFSALTHHMTAQHFRRIGVHADEAELLRGGMLLSYGAHVEAGQIFEKLIEANAKPAVRDRAWFYIAKIRYQRGYIEQAEEALARVHGRLPGELEDERRVLHAMLLMRRQQPEQAVKMLREVSARSSWGTYGRFNLGVALIQAGERDDGIDLLDEIGSAAARNEEQRALRDKANVALAYTFLQTELPALAKTYLERVRMNGLLSNKALLGLGWTHSALGRHEHALAPWQELAQRNVVDAAVQESLLAVPYAFGKLGAYRQSLEGYEAALAVYTAEGTRIDEAIGAIRAGKLVENILRANPADEAGWFWRMEQPPDVPEARYLTQLLASHDFQEALKNYRDLRFLAQNLDGWSSNMHLYGDMAATRRQAYAERLPRVLGRGREGDVERVQQARNRYAAEIERIEREEDAIALADEKERLLLRRLDHAEGVLKRAPDPLVQERVRLLRGLMGWDLSSRYRERLWKVKQGVQELDRLLAESGARRAALTRAQVEAPQEVDAFTARIARTQPRISELRKKVDALAQAQEQQLAALAVDELARQRERIAAYVMQAHFAVAQIYDQAVRVEEKAR